MVDLGAVQVSHDKLESPIHLEQENSHSFVYLFLPTIIYMVQYAIIQHFDQKLQKSENFYLDTILKVKHRMISYICIFFRKRIAVPISMIPGPTDC